MDLQYGKLKEENRRLIRFMDFKDEEIERQIKAKKLAQQSRNWVLILTVIGHLIYWIV